MGIFNGALKLMLAILLLMAFPSCNEDKEKRKFKGNNDATASESPSPSPSASASPEPDDEDDELKVVAGGCYAQITTILSILDPTFTSAKLDELIAKNLPKISETLNGALQASTIEAIKILLGAQSCDKFLVLFEQLLKAQNPQTP